MKEILYIRSINKISRIAIPLGFLEMRNKNTSNPIQLFIRDINDNTQLGTGHPFMSVKT